MTTFNACVQVLRGFVADTPPSEQLSRRLIDVDLVFGDLGSGVACNRVHNDIFSYVDVNVDVKTLFR